MEAFATVDQYSSKYPDPPVEEEVLEEWLADASDVMRARMDAAGVAHDQPSAAFASTLMRVCRDMVHRAIGEDGDEDSVYVPFGTTQMNMSGGSYSRGYSFSNPNDDLYLTSSELSRLGIGKDRAAMLSPYGASNG